MFVRWIALAIVNLFVVVLAYLLAPILPAFAIGRATLPRFLSWFQTPDNPLDGDANFKANVAPFPGEQSGWRQYVNRIFWLWRNPSYGFDLAVLGFTASKLAAVVKVGPLPLAGAPQTGWYFATATNPDGSRAWQFYAVKVWGRCASRVNFGWKLWSAPGLCQFAMTINPYLTIQ